MPIAYRSGSTAYQATGSSMTVPLPAGVEAGDYVIALYTTAPNPTSSALTSPPAGWTEIFPHIAVSTGGASVWGTFYSDGMQNPTWVMSSANPPRSVAIGAWSGVDAATPINTSGTQARSVSSADTVAPSVVTAVDDCVLALLFMAKDNLSTAVTDPAGTVRRALQLGLAGGTSHALICDIPALVAGTTPSFTATFNAAATLNGRGYTIALNPGTPPEPEPTITTTWVGGVTDSSAVVSVRALNTTSVDLVIDGSTLPGTPDADGMAKFSVSGLAPKTAYPFQVQVDGITLSTGSIKTFPVPGTPTSFTIAAGTCQDTGSDPAVFDLIAARAPDLMWHGGDKDYWDFATNDRPAVLESYTSWSGRPKWRSVTATTPTLYTWDNHDWGGPDSDKNAAVGPAMRSVYRQVVPHWTLPSTNQAIYQSTVYGRVRIIALDTRSQRDPISDPESPTKSMLGAEQKAWLAAELRQPEPVKIILCGIMWRDTGGAAGDRWGSFTTEFAEICGDIVVNRDQMGQVYVMSGDRHALAADDGTNSGAGVPNVLAAPLYQVTTAASESWSHGYFRDTGYQSYYGWLEVTDTGSAITLDYTGRDSADVARVSMSIQVDTSQTVTPSGVDSTGAAGAPRLLAGPVAATPSGVAAGAAVGSPTLASSTVSLSPVGIDALAATGSPRVVPGPATLAPTGIAFLAAVGATTLAAGSVRVAPTGIGTAAVVGAPRLVADDRVSVNGIDSLAAVGAPVLRPLADRYAYPRDHGTANPRESGLVYPRGW